MVCTAAARSTVGIPGEETKEEKPARTARRRPEPGQGRVEERSWGLHHWGLAEHSKASSFRQTSSWVSGTLSDLCGIEEQRLPEEGLLHPKMEQRLRNFPLWMTCRSRGSVLRLVQEDLLGVVWSAEGEPHSAGE
ncbi:hypothetical protein P7K49_027342 [Saguinus oedipus]|uniref:Uncharacterized protein n=1 Tax=Saguinus oedipus TaxID=9490 RepID=A0ABQ9U965_SAGOE|nr:hypothetical protein P7K49_027342 [Saguinus oedipus]